MLKRQGYGLITLPLFFVALDNLSIFDIIAATGICARWSCALYPKWATQMSDEDVREINTCTYTHACIRKKK